MQDPHVIVGVHITDRVEHASQVQQVLSAHGARIKTRLGLHELDEGDSPNGLLLLEVVGPTAGADALVADLQAIAGVDCQRMLFPH